MAGLWPDFASTLSAFRSSSAHHETAHRIFTLTTSASRARPVLLLCMPLVLLKNLAVMVNHTSNPTSFSSDFRVDIHLVLIILSTIHTLIAVAVAFAPKISPRLDKAICIGQILLWNFRIEVVTTCALTLSEGVSELELLFCFVKCACGQALLVPTCLEKVSVSLALACFAMKAETLRHEQMVALFIVINVVLGYLHVLLRQNWQTSLTVQTSDVHGSTVCVPQDHEILRGNNRAHSQSPANEPTTAPPPPAMRDDYFSEPEWKTLANIVEKEQQERARHGPAAIIDRVQLGKVLGGGTYGKVCVARDLQMGRIFALKVAKNDYGWQQSAIRAEAAILAQLHHPNLVALHGLVTDQTQLEFGDVGIMTTLCPQGSLDVLLSVVGKLDEEIVRLFTKDIVAAVAYLHRHGVVHRDIKPANCFLKDGRILLGDFGAALLRNSSLSPSSSRASSSSSLSSSLSSAPPHAATSLAGTLLYMSPEAVKSRASHRKVDIWGVGCCTLEMLSGELPFSLHEEENSGKALALLQSANRSPSLPREMLSHSAFSFLSAALRINPRSRPTATWLAQHGFLSGVDADALEKKNEALKTLLQRWGEECVAEKEAASEAEEATQRRKLSVTARMLRRVQVSVEQRLKWWNAVEGKLDNPDLEAGFEALYTRVRFERLLVATRLIFIPLVVDVVNVGKAFQAQDYLDAGGIIAKMAVTSFWIHKALWQRDYHFCISAAKMLHRVVMVIILCTDHTQLNVVEVMMMQLFSSVGYYGTSCSWTEAALFQTLNTVLHLARLAFKFAARIRQPASSSTCLEREGALCASPLVRDARQAAAFYTALDELVAASLLAIAGALLVCLLLLEIRKGERQHFKQGHRGVCGAGKREAARDLKREAARDLKREAARDLKREAARDLKREAVRDLKRESARDLKHEVARDLKREAARDLKREAARDLPPPGLQDPAVRVGAGR